MKKYLVRMINQLQGFAKRLNEVIDFMVLSPPLKKREFEHWGRVGHSTPLSPLCLVDDLPRTSQMNLRFTVIYSRLADLGIRAHPRSNYLEREDVVIVLLMMDGWGLWLMGAGDGRRRDGNVG